MDEFDRQNDNERDFSSGDWTGKETYEHHHRFVFARLWFPVLMFLSAAFIIAILLGGCSLAPKIATPIHATEVYQLGNAYGLVQSAAVTYASFPLCNEALGITKLCRTKEITKLLAKYDAAFNAAYAPLEAFVRNPANYPGLNFAQLISTARSALSTFKAAEQAYNVGLVN